MGFKNCYWWQSCDKSTVNMLTNQYFAIWRQSIYWLSIYWLSTFIPHPNIMSGNIFVEHSNNICRIMKLISLHLVSKWNQSGPQWESCTGYDWQRFPKDKIQTLSKQFNSIPLFLRMALFGKLEWWSIDRLYQIFAVNLVSEIGI